MSIAADLAAARVRLAEARQAYDDAIQAKSFRSPNGSEKEAQSLPDLRQAIRYLENEVARLERGGRRRRISRFIPGV